MIFRIYPDDENPVLLKLAEMALSDYDFMTFDYSLIGNKLIFLQLSTFNVWDFTEDAWACVEVPDDSKHVGLLTKRDSISLLIFGAVYRRKNSHITLLP